jgi:hypothetical protein
MMVLGGGPIDLGTQPLPALAAAMITGEGEIQVTAADDAEILLVQVAAT